MLQINVLQVTYFTKRLFREEQPLFTFACGSLRNLFLKFHRTESRLLKEAKTFLPFAEADARVVGYSANPHNFRDNFNTPGSADRYRPWFIRISNWKQDNR